MARFCLLLFVCLTISGSALPFCANAAEPAAAASPPSSTSGPSSNPNSESSASVASTTNATSANIAAANNAVAEANAVTRQMMENLQRQIEVQVARHTEAITSSLQQIEPALNRIQKQQAEAAASANRTILIAAGLFAVAGFFGLGFLTMASVRAMGRFTEVAVNVASRRQLPAGDANTSPTSTVASPSPEPPFKPIVSGTVEQASARFQGALEQLERRILELEHSAHAPAPSSSSRPTPSIQSTVSSTTPAIKVGLGASPASSSSSSPSQSNGHSAESAPNSEIGAHNPTEADKASGAVTSQLEMQLGRGQALLNLDQAAQAVECFNQVLAEDPDHLEALLRKGIALEKLEDWDHALECYDRVIGLDSSLTVAYLYKGGICNRLERHREALESYEQALHSERTRAVS